MLKCARVRMARLMEERPGVGCLDNSAGIHDLNAVAQARDHTEVMSDEDHGHVELLLEAFDQFENLCLHGDVEGRGRLICNQELRLCDESHGNHDTLSHSPRELMGKVMDALGSVIDPDGVEHLHCAGEGLFSRNLVVDQKRLDQLIRDAQVGVQRRHRILKDHRDAFSADLPGLLGRASKEIHAVEYSGAAFNATRRLWHKAHDRVARDRLSRAGFTNNAQGFTCLQVEAHSVDCAIGAVAGVKPGPEVFD